MRRFTVTVGFYISDTILSRARVALTRISANDDRELGQLDAIDAIVFAAASTEAFINEFTATAYERATYRSTLVAPPDADPVQRTGRVLYEFEESRATIRQKYSLGHFLLCGQNYDRGVQPWQDFDALIGLRDAILHYKMDKFEFDPDGNRGTYPKFVERLSNRDVLGSAGKGVTMPWIAVVATRAAATWAVNSACSIVLSILDAVPANDPLHNTVLRQRFQPIA
jgi:hypothetical protein